MVHTEIVPTRDRSNRIGWLLGALSCGVLVTISFFVVDRPVATFAHEHLRGAAWFVWLTHIPELFLPIASLALVTVALATAFGLRLGRVGDGALRCSLSIVAATTLGRQLKYIFGRTWPETWTNNNPSFFGNGAYGFMPFHGGVAYASFPSGHTTAMFSALVVLWIYWPRFRWLYVLLTSLVVIGLIGADFHWLSDMIAGAYLGTAAGITAASIGRRGATGNT